MAQFATIFVVLAALAGPSLTAEVPINDGKYLLDYRVIIPSTLVIKITAETTGWVGWGISPDGAMIGGDMVMGGWDSSKGAYIGDRYSSAPGPPRLDQFQNVMLYSAWENTTHTVLEFARALDTGDEAEDHPVLNESQFILWAYGETDDIAYHGQERGAIEINLMNG